MSKGETMNQAARKEFEQGDPRRIGWVDGLPNAKLADDLGPIPDDPAEANVPPVFWGRRSPGVTRSEIGRIIEPEIKQLRT